MKQTTFQHPEIRDANDNIIQAGTYGKESPLVNSTNDGVLDYINNNLEALYDNTMGGTGGTINTETITGKTGTITNLTATTVKAGTLTADTLNGGTMTGYLQFNASEGRIQNYRSDNDGMVSVYGGQGYTSGGYLSVYGKNHASYAGMFRIFARDDTNGTKELRGTPGGTLTWDNKEIERVSAKGTYGIRLESGIQICWGTLSIPAGTAGREVSDTMTFPYPFANTNYVLTFGNDWLASSSEYYRAEGRNTANFKFTAVGVNSNPHKAFYIAIGYWK